MHCTRCSGTIPKQPVIMECRHSVTQQQGLIIGGQSFHTASTNSRSSTNRGGVMEKVEHTWEIGRSTIKVGELWKCLQLYP